MKKIILVAFALGIVNCADAVKLCKYAPTCTWSTNGSVSVSGACSGTDWDRGTCSCRATLTVNGCSITGNSVDVGSFWFSGCPYDCEYCERSACQSRCERCVSDGDSGNCSRSGILTGGSSVSTVNAGSVTCPLSGTCTNTNYKTIGDGDSCGSNWSETTSPTLTIGVYSDDNGTFSGTCTK